MFDRDVFGLSIFCFPSLTFWFIAIYLKIYLLFVNCRSIYFELLWSHLSMVKRSLLTENQVNVLYSVIPSFFCWIMFLFYIWTFIKAIDFFMIYVFCGTLYKYGCWIYTKIKRTKLLYGRILQLVYPVIFFPSTATTIWSQPTIRRIRDEEKEIISVE